MMEQLCGYTLTGDMTNKNAGFSMWCFGIKGGKEYFIKQFLSPKYPYNDTVSSAKRIEKNRQACEAFEKEKISIYNVVNNFSDGNDVRIREFFRNESRFYIVMEKIDALPWEIPDLAALSEVEKRYLCAIVSHAVAALHRGGLIHADLKHENILYTKAANGNITAKVIDFDSAFLESDPPEGSNISGDWVYFSPEVWARTSGMDSKLTCKMDVFALGVLFHQYFSGELPGFSKENGVTATGQAVLADLPLTLSETIPEDVRELLSEMLRKDPDERPAAEQVFQRLQPKVIRDFLEANNIRETPVRNTRYCTMCGSRFEGLDVLCPACRASDLTVRFDRGPVDGGGSSGGGNGFRKASDLL